jgi:hypothetical protein
MSERLSRALVWGLRGLMLDVFVECPPDFGCEAPVVLLG